MPFHDNLRAQKRPALEERRMVRVVILATLAAFAVSSPALSRNTPCSGSKGGVKACMGEKFLCNDGSTSASKKTCSRAGSVSDDGDDEPASAPNPKR